MPKKNPPRKLGFNSGEHSQILEQLPEGIPSEITINEFSIELRTIVALADFFYPYSKLAALTNENICTIAAPTSDRTSEDVFNDNFNEAFSQRKQNYLKKCLTIIKKEEAGIKSCQDKGVEPSVFYQKQGAKLNREYTFASPSNYLVAALTDYDHFVPDAITAYTVGRDIAFNLAKEAFQEIDPQEKKKKFELACAKLAFAFHFFTDSFSAGHIATPRRALTRKCGLLFGSLLAKKQHDEACQLGFNCKNKNDTGWTAYGDGRYFDKVNKENRNIVSAATKQVFQDLLTTYQTGQFPSTHKEENALPQLLPLDDQKTCVPLFIEDTQGKLLRRKEVSNPLCREYTENWHVLSTLFAHERCTDLATYSQKALLKSENQKAFHAFKLSSDTEYIKPTTALLPNRLFSKSTTRYTKKNCHVGANNIDFLYKNGQFDSFLWGTEPEKIRQAVRWGIYKPQALSSQAIATLGAYQRKTLERAYQEGIISNRYEEKKQLVNITLDRIEALQELERLINNYDATVSPIENYWKIKSAFSHYIEQLEEIKQKIIAEIAALQNYDLQATQKITNFINKDIASVMAYQRWLEDCILNERLTESFIHNHILTPLGSSSLFSWIKCRIISATKQCQEINQNLSYGIAKNKRNTLALMRGDLNSFVEDTLKVTNTYSPDLYNKILPEHQGHFRLEAGKERLALDFNFNQGNDEANRQALMAICHIEEVDSIQRFTEGWGSYHLVTQKNPPEGKEANEAAIALKETAYTKWDRQGLGKLQFIERLLKGACNIVTGIAFGLTFDLAWGLIGGIGCSLLQAFAYQSDHWGYAFFSFSLAEKLKFETETLPSSETKFAELLEHIPSRKLPLGRKFGQKIANLFVNTIWELFKGIKTLLNQSKIELIDNLADDWHFGHHPLTETKEAKEILQVNLFTLRSMRELAHKNLVKNYQTEYKQAFPNFESSSQQSALPPYLLKPPVHNDALNALAKGINDFFGSFLHHIYAKHPFTGLVFTLAYTSGGLSILMPKLMASILGKNFVAFSQALGQALAHGKLSETIAAGFMEAKVAAAICEALFHGRKSWLSKGIQLLEKEPADIIIYTTMAVGLGFLIAHELNIPWLSEHIREDLGNFPIPTLAFAGAKVAVLLVELLEKRNENTEFFTKDWMLRFQEEIESYYREKNKIPKSLELTSAQTEEIQSIIDTLLNEENIEKLEEKLKEQRTSLAMTAEEKQNLNENLQRINFLNDCLADTDLLAKLDHRSKRTMFELVKRDFIDQPAVINAIKELLYPKKTYSILQTTLLTLFLYVPLAVRCLATVVTWNAQPWRDLGNKLLMDLSHVAHAVKTIVAFISYGLSIMVKSLADIIFNELGARLEAWLRGDKHSLSHSNYAVSNTLSQMSSRVETQVAKPIDLLERETTTPHPKATLAKYTYSLFSKIMLEIQKPKTEAAQETQENTMTLST